MLKRNDGGRGFFLGDKVCGCVRESLPSNISLHESYPLSPLSQQFLLHGTAVSNPLLTGVARLVSAMLIVIAVDLCGHCCVPSTEGNRVPVSRGVQVFGHPPATWIQAEDAATPSDQDVPRVRALAEFLWKLNDVIMIGILFK